MNDGRSYLRFFILTFFAILLLFPCTSSADYAANWFTVTSGTDNWFNGITFGNGTFVTVGAFGTILTSSDGVVWSLQTSGDTYHLYSVAYGNSIFIAVGFHGRTFISSDDGVTWRSGGTAPSGAADLYGVTYGKGTFVAVGNSGTIFTSPDGVAWTPQASGTINQLSGVTYSTYGSGTFVAVGDGTILTSPDGETWSKTLGISDRLTGVTYGNGIFVAVGLNGTILISSDLVTWTPITLGISRDLYGVTFGNNTFIAVGAYNGESGTILTSDTNGVSWHLRDSGTTYDLEGIAYGHNPPNVVDAFVAVGGFGTILINAESLPYLPVRIYQTLAYFSTLQGAYDNTSSSNAIQSMALHFNESPLFNKPISITLEGGYDVNYDEPNTSYTTIDGTLTISDGTVVLENIIIQ
jgi:hypothetical protein